MKNRKILFALLVLSLLLSLLSVTVSAAGKLVVDEGLSSLTYNGEKYVRVESSAIDTINYTSTVYSISFSASDEKIISYASAFANDYAIEIYIDYESGGSGVYYYVRSDLLDEYELTLKYGGERGEMHLDYSSIEVDIDKLYGEKLTLAGYELDSFPINNGYVSHYCFDGYLTFFARGYILSNNDGEFFYVDTYQFGEQKTWSELAYCDNITVWRITDKSVIGSIREHSDNTYDDYYGDIYDDYSETDMFVPGLIIFGAVLGLLPLIVGIVTIIISAKAKAPYKKWLRMISGFCFAAAAITVVTIIVCVILA